jgi:hypothetical protein
MTIRVFIQEPQPEQGLEVTVIEDEPGCTLVPTLRLQDDVARALHVALAEHYRDRDSNEDEVQALRAKFEQERARADRERERANNLADLLADLFRDMAIEAATEQDGR